jgi:hypothetical protein
MASLSRKFLDSIGIEGDKVDLIIERHNEVLTEIKDERDQYKKDAETLPEIQKQLNQYMEMEKKAEKDPYKVKYEAIKEDFEEYKKGVLEKETAHKKETEYRRLLKESGVSEKRISAILKVTNLDGVELDENGNAKNADDLMKSIKDEWSDFIQVKKTEGANIANPPANGGKAVKTKEEIRAIADPIARQKAMAENPTLFGLPDNSKNE